MVRKLNFIYILFLYIFIYKSIFSQDKLSNLKYDGDILFRSFYVYRDVLLKKQSTEVCPYPLNTDINQNTISNTKCKEKLNEQIIRFRLNLIFNPNIYTEIYYGLEVGDITFGREKNLNGPSSGGSGSGATNVETRELRFSIFNQDKSTIFDLGIFPYSTPYGLIFASSGAGIRLRHNFQTLNSLIETIYYKLQDYSYIDNDSNGFSDKNYNNVDFFSLSYKIFRFNNIIPEFYFVYKRDPIEKDSNNNPKDLYQFYWLEIFFQFSYKNWNIDFNLVNQQGYYISENKIIENESFLKQYLNSFYNELLNYNNDISNKHRKKYPKNAYAGNIDISLKILNYIHVSYIIIAATGRQGVNNDGTITTYNKDQYSSAAGSVQFTDIGLDSSGGYSLLNINSLGGLIVNGIKIKFQLFQGLTFEPQYYIYKTHKTPNIEYNKFFTRSNFNNPTNQFGEEWNVSITHQPWVYFNIKLKFAYFKAKEAYKSIYDIKNGDSLREYSIFIQQKF